MSYQRRCVQFSAASLGCLLTCLPVLADDAEEARDGRRTAVIMIETMIEADQGDIS